MGFCFGSSFPTYNLQWLGAIALRPLLIAVAREESARLRFLYGWIAGVLYWFTLCTWIQFVLEVHGGMGKWGGWGSFLLFCVLKAIHLGVFAGLRDLYVASLCAARRCGALGRP